VVARSATVTAEALREYGGLLLLTEDREARNRDLRNAEADPGSDINKQNAPPR
jgi:hypothetical protein